MWSRSSEPCLMAGLRQTGDRRRCMNRNEPATLPTPTGSSPTDGVRLWPAKRSRLIEGVAGEDGLHPPPCR